MEPPRPPRPRSLVVLPKPSELSSQQIGFIVEHLRTHEDLVSRAPHLLAKLNSTCADLDSHLLNLRTTLTKRVVSWISRSFAAKNTLHNLNFKLHNLSLRSSPNGTGSKKLHKILGEELPQLAKQVRQIDTIRTYIETTLRLEALVGDLEDAAFCFVNRHTGNMFSDKNSGPKPNKLLQAIKTMNDIEDVLFNVVKFHPLWHSLLKSVDSRVEKTLGVLRPQVFADHRALLASLGWPPKLLTSKIDSGQISGIPNPLLLMQRDKRESYSRSFIALCALQHLQTRREERQHNLFERKEYKMQLWAIDELVSPIASRMEYHFSKWADQPEFIFALLYKITRDFIVGVDDVLQPLIDRARLVSCSAKEAWVAAMVQMLSGFLAKKVFSALAERYKEKHMKPEVITSWLHLIDLIVASDKQMQSLVDLELLADSKKFVGHSRGISVLTIFCDNPAWLKIWAKIELRDACKKLKAELKDERAWIINNKGGSGLHITTDTEQYLLCTREDHKAPSIAESALRISWEIIERCQTMPATLPRIQFIRSAAVKFLWYFFEVLLLRCKGTMIPHDDPDDDAFIRLCGLINAARYVEYKLQEWSDDVDILEMKIAENDSNHDTKDDSIENSCFFEEEIKNLSELETNWLMEIIAVLLHQFENLSWEYVQNKEHFEQEQEQQQEDSAATMDLVVSADFVEALDALRTQLHVVKTSLNPKDFLDLWRSVAEGLDHFISRSILASEIRFSDKGVNQFENDMQALLGIFQPFCARPQAFFPCTKETLKLLKMNKEEVKHVQVVLCGENAMKCLRLCGFSHVSFHQVDQVLRNRKFGT